MRLLFRWLAVGFAMSAVMLGAAPRQAILYGKSYLNFNDLSVAWKLRRTHSQNAWQYFRGTRKILQLCDRSLCAQFDGMDVALSSQVVYQGGTPYIAATDWQSTLRVLLSPSLAKRQNVRTIVLDPGHGGRDRGAAGRYIIEKKMTLRLALRVAALLRAKGYRVLLTRTNDKMISLPDRAAFAKRNHADVFASIHFNSAGNAVHGIETYCLTPAGAPSSNDRAKNKGDKSACIGNRWDANNLVLAAKVHQRMLVRTGAADRGLKRARFAVLRDLTMPGILIEAGFLSNRYEEKNLLSNRYFEILAQAIADGIDAYAKSVK